jgi:hypothetical protein
VEEEGGGVGFHKNLDAPPSFSAWPCAGSAGEAGGDRETRGVWPALRVWGQGSCRARRGGWFSTCGLALFAAGFFFISTFLIIILEIEINSVKYFFLNLVLFSHAIHMTYKRVTLI